ncbi:hypothetical protein MBEHAL_1957 [Halarchaeum acidiphilum MH1-52-1]|uniref:Uncharacterized protein n=1 Tax=Halarchaeum acidiphilum MH1-52-1 TaxID=1261545 RepID=U2YWM6_9EURY|nr:hypothetical protein [Halarchaeum acidiphilum]GAD53197.1 hypothetical protein MBEHAL_1957 [Halarchaeum acidiphilum MH1-52-1]
MFLHELYETARERDGAPALTLWTVAIALLAVAFDWSLAFAVGVYAGGISLRVVVLAVDVFVPDPFLSIAVGSLGVAGGLGGLYALATHGEATALLVCFGIAFGVVGCYVVADGVRRYRVRSAKS